MMLLSFLFFFLRLGGCTGLKSVGVSAVDQSSASTTVLTERNVRGSTSASQSFQVVQVLEDGTNLARRSVRTSWPIRAAIRKTFLPSGYPNSVPREYISYQRYHVLQDLATQVRNTLATQRVLTGLGVGSADATATSAITSWLLRDGAGMVSSLLFTGMNSDVFGTDVRRWRFFADTIVDAGILCELCAGSFFPLATSYDKAKKSHLFCFLGLLASGSVCKALCGVAAGSANSAINLHFAESGGDIAEIAAKGNAIGTISGLVGLLLSLGLAQMTGGPGWGLKSAWTWFWSLTFLHLWACRRGLRLLVLKTISMPRLDVLINEFIDGKSTAALLKKGNPESDERDAQYRSCLSTPEALALKERVAAPPSSFPQIKIGVSLSRLTKKQTRCGKCYTIIRPAVTTSLLWEFNDEKFVPIVARKSERHKLEIMVLLKDGAMKADELRAAVFSLLLLKRADAIGKVGSAEVAKGAIFSVKNEFDTTFPAFLSALERSGWGNFTSTGDLAGLDLRLLSGSWRFSVECTGS